MSASFVSIIGCGKFFLKIYRSPGCSIRKIRNLYTHLLSYVAAKNVVRIYTGGGAESCLAVFIYLLSELIETTVKNLISEK